MNVRPISLMWPTFSKAKEVKCCVLRRSWHLLILSDVAISAAAPAIVAVAC